MRMNKQSYRSAHIAVHTFVTVINTKVHKSTSKHMFFLLSELSSLFIARNVNFSNSKHKHELPTLTFFSSWRNCICCIYFVRCIRGCSLFIIHFRISKNAKILNFLRFVFFLIFSCARMFLNYALFIKKKTLFFFVWIIDLIYHLK